MADSALPVFLHDQRFVIAERRAMHAVPLTAIPVAIPLPPCASRRAVLGNATARAVACPRRLRTILGCALGDWPGCTGDMLPLFSHRHQVRVEDNCTKAEIVAPEFLGVKAVCSQGRPSTLSIILYAILSVENAKCGEAEAVIACLSPTK